MKKIVAVLLSCLLMLGVVGLAACQKDESDEKKLQLNKSEISITVVETATLTASNAEGQITWESADEKIATVSEGVVTPVSLGKTKIKAKSNSQEATCEVTVTAPQGDIKAYVNELEMSILVGETLSMTGLSAEYEGKTYDGADLQFTSTDTGKVTVATDGKVTGVAAGEAQIKVNGKFKGVDLKEHTVDVTVSNNVALHLNLESDPVKIYTSVGTDEENPLPVSYTLNPTVVVNGEETENAVVLTTENTDIVAIEGYKITAKSAGVAVINAETVTEEGDKASASFSVQVSKPEEEAEIADLVVDLGKSMNLSVFGLDDEEILSVTAEGGVGQIEDGQVKFPANIAVGEGKTIRVETQTRILLYNATIATMTIASAQDLDAFANKYLEWSEAQAKVYVAVTESFDYGGGKTYSDIIQNYNSTGSVAYGFYGTFNGMGNTINNIYVKYGFIPRIFAGGVVKNLAVTNMTKSGNGTGFAGAEIHGTMENCYFEGTMSENPAQTSADYTSFVYEVKGSVRNVVVNVSGRTSEQNKQQNAGVKTVRGTVENLYVITDGSNGKLYDNITEGVYDSKAEFKKDVPEISKKFTADCWSVDTGMLMFKSAEQFWDIEGDVSLPELTETITLTSVGEGSSIVLDLTTEMDGSPMENPAQVISYQVETQGIVNISADGWKYTISAQDLGSTKITFTFKITDSYSVERVVTVNVDSQPLETDGEVIIDLFKGEADWAQFNIEETTLKSLSLGGKAVDGAKVENGKLIIPSADGIPVGENVEIVIKTDTDSYKGTVTVATMTIASADDLNTFASKYVEWSDAKAKVHIIVTQSFDYGGGKAYSDAIKNYNGDGSVAYGFYGTFDGRGNTINNIYVAYGFIPRIFVGGVVKNLAVMNMTKSGNGTGFAGAEIHGLMENCYFEGTMSENPAQSSMNYTSFVYEVKGTVRNVVVNVSGRTSSQNQVPNAGINNMKGTVENLYVITDGSNGKLYGDITECVYKTKAAFKKDVPKISKAFTADCWSVDTGMLMFKSAEQFWSIEDDVKLPALPETVDLASAGDDSTTTLDLSVYFEGVLMENPTEVISYTVETEGVVTVSSDGWNYTISAQELGTTKVNFMFKITEEYTVERIVTVKVDSLPLVTDDEVIIDLSKGETDWAQFNIAEITLLSLSLGGKVVEGASINEGKLVLPSIDGIPAGENIEIVIKTDTASYKGKVTVATMTIASADDLNTFASKYVEWSDAKAKVHVIVTESFDYGGSKTYSDAILNYNSTGSVAYGFYGTFDGRGNTINNIYVKYGFIPRIFAGGVVKNLAVTNMTKSGNAAGFAGAEVHGLMENCYFEGTMSENPAQASADYTSFVYEVKGTVRNVVVNVSGRTSEQNKQQNAGVKSVIGTVENLYVITDGSNGKLYGDITEGVYANVEDFNADLSEISPEFTASCWSVDSGTLMFKTAEQFITETV